MVDAVTRLAVADAPAVLSALVRARHRADRTTVVAVDGRTGSGKTSLAAALARALEAAGTAVAVLAVEDLVPGWDALAEGVRRTHGALAAVARGEAATVETWDWGVMAPGAVRVIVPAPGGVLLVEGCGALAAVADLPATRVWVEAPDDVRHARLSARDPYPWDVGAWEAQERSAARTWAPPGAAAVVDAVVLTAEA